MCIVNDDQKPRALRGSDSEEASTAQQGSPVIKDQNRMVDEICPHHELSCKQSCILGSHSCDERSLLLKIGFEAALMTVASMMMLKEVPDY